MSLAVYLVVTYGFAVGAWVSRGRPQLSTLTGSAASLRR